MMGKGVKCGMKQRGKGAESSSETRGHADQPPLRWSGSRAECLKNGTEQSLRISGGGGGACSPVVLCVVGQLTFPGAHMAC